MGLLRTDKKNKNGGFKIVKNIFWNIYINLEKEILNLANMVHFTDNQVSVYSVRISDLLIRCNVEIESLIKELHKRNFPNEKPLDKVGDMLVALNKAWTLEKKQVLIISTNMHFSKTYSLFCPFYYSRKDGNDFYSAYNAIKHDRASNFEKYATIHYLIRALGALYLLNLYYREEEFGNLKNNYKLDSSLGSKIFSFHTEILKPKYPVKQYTFSKNEELSALYIIKPVVESYSEYYKEFDGILPKQKKIIKSAGYIMEKDENGNELEISYDELYKIALEYGGAELIKSISELENSATKKYQTMAYTAIINKSCEVYYLECNEEERLYE